MEGNNAWANLSVRERPFWREGMSAEEYELERAYYYRFSNDGKKNADDYLPIWKQGKRFKCNLNDCNEVLDLAEKIIKMPKEEVDRYILG